MASKIEISNEALGLLGQETIRDFDENNVRARQCRIFYNSERRRLLRLFHWTFAKKTVLLSVLTDNEQNNLTSDRGYAYVYKLPADCLTPIKRADSNDPRSVYEIIGDQLHSSINPFILEYTSDCEESGLFTPEFEESLSLKMAVKMCVTLTQNKTLREELKEDYRSTLALAMMQDANLDSDYRQTMEDPNYDTFVNPGV